MKTHRFQINTARTETVSDITDEVERFVRGQPDGLLNISLLHATAGLALIETDSGTEEDLLDAVQRLLPRDHGYAHSHGSVGHGASHVLPAFIAPTLTLPVVGGEVVLGTWQRITIVDTNVDNHSRVVMLSLLS